MAAQYFACRLGRMVMAREWLKPMARYSASTPLAIRRSLWRVQRQMGSLPVVDGAQVLAVGKQENKAAASA